MNNHPPLSAEQEAVVRHGTPQPVAADVVVVLSDRHEHRPYGSRETRPETNTSAGYCEVYEVNGLWFGYRESNGGSMRTTGLPSREEAEAQVRAAAGGSRRFWDALAALVGSDVDRHGRQVIRSAGWHYTVGPENDGSPRDCRGFGGAKWRFRMNDGRIVESTNLWSQGRIPDDYRDRMPDNAVQEKT